MAEIPHGLATWPEGKRHEMHQTASCGKTGWPGEAARRKPCRTLAALGEGRMLGEEFSSRQDCTYLNSIGTCPTRAARRISEVPTLRVSAGPVLMSGQGLQVLKYHAIIEQEFVFIARRT